MAARCCKKNMDTEKSPMSKLTDDLLVEIISRVPFKSTCLCKCVSTHWRDVVSHPDHRKKLPQTLAGFFYHNNSTDHVHPGYQSVSGNWYGRIDTSLSFLPKCETFRYLFLLDCCNGLLLCRRRQRHPNCQLVYLVYNPATEKSVAVPPTSWTEKVHFARLAFDPAVSSHFHVFEFAQGYVVDADMKGDASSLIKGVRIYSSKAGAWTHPIVWDNPVSISSVSKGVFFSGLLYLPSCDDFVLAVGLDGNCSVISVPISHSSRDVHSVFLSQGQLHLTNNGASGLSIWNLEYSGSEHWILKHNVSNLQLLGTEYSMFAGFYTVISIHPDSNLIFIVCSKVYRAPVKLMSYETDSGKLRFICDIPWGCRIPYLSYVPVFSESLTDGN